MEKYSIVAALELGNTYSGYDVLERCESETNQQWKRKSYKRMTTCIRFNEERSSEVFRYAAERQISDPKDKDDTGKFFRLLLSKLETEGKIDKNRKDDNGKPVTAGVFFDEYIWALIKDLMEELNKNALNHFDITSDKIRWVITVPTDLTDIAKERTRKCAGKALIPPGQLTMVTKLEATFSYCQKYLERDQYSSLEDSTKFMIVDFQDCVVDMRVVKRIGDRIIEKYHKSISAYDKFLQLLKGIFGIETVDSFVKDWPFASSDFKRELALGKKRISLGNFIKYCKDTRKEDFIITSLAESGHGDKINIEGDDMILDDHTFKDFQLTIDVIFQMETVFTVYEEACKVKFVVITGDFDICNKNAIGNKFPQKRIIFSKSNEEAVMSGVVLYGNQPYQFFSEVPRIIAEGVNYTTVVALHLGTTYCGYAFSFCSDPVKIHINPPWICENMESSRKTSSCICVNDNITKLAFGYEAETKYAEFLKQNDDTCHFVRPLKSLLLEEKDINFDTWKLKTTKGKLDGATTLKEFIGCLIDHSMNEIKKKKTDATIDKTRWVITVPVGQTNNAGVFMKDCTSWLFAEILYFELKRQQVSKDEIEKCLQQYEHEQLMIVTEAEATFAYCQNFLKSDQYSRLEDSTEYMIVGLGGCVVDVRVLKKVGDTVIEICRSSRDYTSKSAYTNMLEILKQKQKKSRDDSKTATAEDILSELHIERLLEKAKYNHDDLSTCKNLLQTYIDKYGIQKDGNKIEVDDKMCGHIFLPTIAEVLSEMEKVFRNHKEAHKIQFIFMTGDFYECCLLEHAIEVKFPQKCIIFSKSDEEAVMKGAVLFGQQPFQYTLKSLHVYEKKPEQKGLLLVINYTFSGEENERRGSDEDVGKLRSFFTNLNYDVLCRSDMKVAQLKKQLKQVKENYLTKNAEKYHCFICVIMSHGNKEGISTGDSIISVDDVINPFRNDEARHFIGKPKIFMIQTCRGKEEQEKYRLKGPVGGRQKDNNQAPRMPKDSDILKIYATPPGYVSTREPKSPKWKGAWLIQAFLCVAKQYPKNHLLELLTAVNFELANNPEYEEFGGKCQVSISESALSKLFYL